VLLIEQDHTVAEVARPFWDRHQRVRAWEERFVAERCAG
jgi:hypothetical protein